MPGIRRKEILANLTRRVDSVVVARPNAHDAEALPVI